MNKHSPSNRPRLTRRQLAARLRELGYPIGDSTLDKLCMPSIGGGPPVCGYWGKRPLYEEGSSVAWAESKLQPTKAPPADRTAGTGVLTKRDRLKQRHQQVAAGAA
jgi:hypothetical protein